MPRATRRSGGRCTCDFTNMVASWILFAIGLYFIVWSFAGQFTNTLPGIFVVIGYFIGALIISLGKWTKWRGHGHCPVHGGKM